jgi:hypothetical protein
MWTSQENLEEDSGGGSKRSVQKTERSIKTGSEQDQMQEFHGCPMLQKELQELSQVSLTSRTINDNCSLQLVDCGPPTTRMKREKGRRRPERRKDFVLKMKVYACFFSRTEHYSL